MSTEVLENGSPPTTVDPPQIPSPQEINRFTIAPLSYPRANKSTLRMGSINTATAQLDELGIHQCIAFLYRFMTEARALEDPPQLPLYVLRCAELIEQAGSQLEATSELARPITTVEEFHERRRQFELLMAKKSSPFRREIEEAAIKVVGDCFDQIAQAIDNAAHADILGIEACLEEVEKHLDQVVCPDPSKEDSQQLARVSSFLVTVNTADNLPEPKRESLRNQVLSKSQQAFALTLRDLAAVEVAIAVQHQVTLMRAHCRSLSKSAKACRHHIEGVQSLLNNEIDLAKEYATGAFADGVIVLDGPSQEKCLKEIKESLGCSAEQLVHFLMRSYDEELENRYADQLDEFAGRGQVLALVTPEEGASVLQQLVRDQLSGQSIYVAIDRYGVAPLVEELATLSEPLVHLSRKNAINNIEPAFRTTLVVPPPVNIGDHEVLRVLRIEVKKAIASRGSDLVAVQVKENAGQACHLTQTLMGYCAAVLADNHALAWAYCRSKEHHHLPHLFGALPDSPDGQASEIVVEMFRCLETLQGEVR